MFKRLFLVALVSFTLGQLFVMGVRTVQGRSPLPWLQGMRNASYIQDVIRLVNEHYVEELPHRTEGLTDAALQGILSSLDAHSEFLSPRRFEALREETSQQFGGIGIQVEMRNGWLTVVAPIADTPGEQAGILPGDQIIAIGGQSTERMSMSDSITRLRGAPGEPVLLTVRRPRTGEVLEKRVVRQVIAVQNVREVQMLEEGIGYVRILSFGEKTGDEFRRALQTLETEGMEALVIDLRNNPGGLLDAAVSVAETFFPRGELIVYTQGRRENSRNNLVSRLRGSPRNLPIAVLINQGSASASEIVAGALKDTRRAILVGEKTFGKGSVQTILPLRNGEAIRLTTALYYTPGGDVIHERGIMPHIQVSLTPEQARKLTLQRSRYGTLSREEFEERFGFAPIPDLQKETAVEALRALLLEVGREPEPSAWTTARAGSE